MSLAVLVITHGNAGKELLATAERFVGPLEGVRWVHCETGEACTTVEQHIEEAMTELGTSEALFLVDLYGSTPARLCCKRCHGNSVVVAGLNLAMLMKLATVDRDKDVHQIAEELAASAQKSVQVYHNDGAARATPVAPATEEHKTP